MDRNTERTYRTDGGCATPVHPFPARDIESLRARVRKITTTDEGKLQVVIEGELADTRELDKIRDLLLIQQGEVTIDIRGVQGELPL